MISSENWKSTFRDHACRKRVDKRRVVDETASPARYDLLRRLVFEVGKIRARNAPRERMVMTGQTAADADAERYAAR
jgi:hypothetical protein